MNSRLLKKLIFAVVFSVFFLSSCNDNQYFVYKRDDEVNLPVINIGITPMIDLDSVEKYDAESLIPTAFKLGTMHSLVTNLQQKLMNLGYMDKDKPSIYYGESTESAIKKFERQLNIEQDGVCTPQLYDMLMDKNCITYEAKLGYKGEDISTMQQRLYELSYLLNEEDINGVFDEKMEAAIKEMQRNNKMEETGTVDLSTMNILNSDEVIAYTINKQSAAYIIAGYQEKLLNLGYYIGQIDGKYNEDFKEAVKTYQYLNNITADGYIGPSTRFYIDSKFAKPFLIHIGMRNYKVKQIQDRLVALGYLESRIATGYMNEYSAQAVALFQKNNGLEITGHVNAQTQVFLNSPTAVRAKEVLKSPYQFVLNTMDIRKSLQSTKPVGTVEDLIKLALLKLGCKYVWAAKGPNTFDCSGFVYWCLNQVGIEVNYMTTYTWRSSTQFERVEKFDDLVEGDLIVIDGHMGIVADNQTVIDASSSNGKVVHRDLDDWWRQRFLIGFKIFTNEVIETE